MSYQADKEYRNRKQDKKPRSDEQLSRETNYPGMPNSAMLSAALPSPGTPNSIMREMLGPRMSAAEDEADRLSAGINSGTPDSVLREMGSRLGSDFSSVRFHSGPESVRRNESMGARAFTQQSDIYFGKGGFDPRVAAHELVHTVQQGAARGSVRQSVAPGTIQMWSFWPFGKKKSKYDKEQDPADIADSLFRIRAGFTASEEREKAERDAQYAKTYDREMKRINRANRGLIREEGAEEQDQEIARNAAQQSTSNLRVKRKDYVSKDDKAGYISKIRSITKETYKELLDRRFQAAKELDDFFTNLNQGYGGSADENKYRAASNEYGRNFKLYTQIIQNVERVHANDEVFQQWKQELTGRDKEKNKILTQVEMILNEGTSANNRYLQTEEGIRERANNSKDGKEFYKNTYKKKKTKLDRMAAVYKRWMSSRNELNNELRNGPHQPNLTGSEDKASERSGMDDISDELIPKRGKNKGENIISTVPDEADANDRSFIDTGIKRNKTDIFSANMMDEEDENNKTDNTVKSAVEKYVSEHSGMDENNMPEDENDQIIRQPGIVTDELADQFVPADTTVGEVKDKNNKGNFVDNIAKAMDNVDQLGTAFYDQNLLNSQNANTVYVRPAIAGAASGLGVLTGLAGTFTGAKDTIRNFHNVKAGAKKMEVVNSGLDTLASVGNTAASGINTMRYMGGIPVVGGAFEFAGSIGKADLIPGLNVAAGGITAFTGAYESIRGQKSINRIDNQIKGLKKFKGHKDQEKLMQIFRQGRRVGELHRTSGAMKAVGGGITLGTGIALLSGPLAPVTAAVLGISGAGFGIFNFIYGKKKKAHIRKDVTAEEIGIDNWDKEIKWVQDRFPREKLSKKEAKEIILKGKGIDAKTRTEAFKQINLKRADTLLEIAEKQGPLQTLAEKVITALGVHRKKGRFAAGAQKLIAEKLGG